MFSDIMKFIRSFNPASLEEGNILPHSFQDMLSPFTNVAGQLNNGAKIAGLAIVLVLALLCCFLGYRLSRAFMSLTGFIAGALIGYVIYSQFLHGKPVLGILCVVAGGLLLAAVSFWIYMAGLFIMCFCLAFAGAATLINMSGDFAFFLYTLIGIGIACLALKYIRPVLIFMSGIVGGCLAGGMVYLINARIAIRFLSLLPSKFLLPAGLSVIGIIIQFLTTKEPAKRKKPKHNKKNKPEKKDH